MALFTRLYREARSTKHKIRWDLTLDKLTSPDIKVKIKCSRYRPGVAQTVGRGIALLFHDRGTRRG